MLQLSCLLKELDTIADIIPQAIRDVDNSFVEFHKVLQKVENCTLKSDIRNQVKTDHKRTARTTA